jgi:hypothetical protein
VGVSNRALMARPTRPPTDEHDRDYRSRALLAAADATVLLVDRQLQRLQAAADLYRERLEAGMGDQTDATP